MTIADVLAILIALVIIGLAIPALFLMLTIFFSSSVVRARHQLNDHPKRTLLRGFLTFIGLFLITTIFASAPLPLLKFFSFLVVLMGLSLTMIGGAGLASQLATRYRAIDGSHKSLTDLFFSSLIIEFATLIPLVGWFVILPITFLFMLGAGCASILQRKKTISTIQHTQPLATISTVSQ